MLIFRWQTLVEVLLFVASGVLASVYRDFLSSASTFPVIYFAASFVGGLVGVAVLGLQRTFWRLSTTEDVWRIVVAAALAVSVTAIVSFSVNRLDGTARGLPPLHLAFFVGLQLLGRYFAQVRYRQRHLAKRSAPDSLAKGAESTLVLGLNSVSSAFIRATVEFNSQLSVAGVITLRKAQVGRIFAGFTVRGTVKDVEAVIAELAVQGINVRRIAICVPFAQLSAANRETLAALARQMQIELHAVCDLLKLQAPAHAHLDPEIEIEATGLDDILRRPYWRIKRVLDFTGAALGLVLAFPFLLIGACAVAIRLGFPVFFWQQRPGYNGIPFKVYKLRTLHHAVTPDGRLLSDDERHTQLGTWLRRTRIDELAQLFNILRGEMSFIGPRPLLPVDQDISLGSRLRVRPGITGWAQVNGGRIVTAADKAALDFWYIAHASLWLDIKIAFLTFALIIQGEREKPEKVRQCWVDLAGLGLVRR